MTCVISGKTAVQNGALSGQTATDLSTDTAAVNGTLTADGELSAAATEEDAVVSRRRLTVPTHTEPNNNRRESMPTYLVSILPICAHCGQNLGP